MGNTSSSDHHVRPELELLEDRSLLSTASVAAGLYTTLLHRAASPAEVAAVTNVIDSGAATPLQVAQNFVNSAEYQSAEVQTDYQRLLLRPATPQDVAAGVHALQAGITGTQLLDGILSSPEYFQRHGGTFTSWADAVYKDVLGRPAGPAEQAAVARQLQSGVPLQAVALGILTSPESFGRIVTAAYENVLGRPPDPAGLAAGVAALQQGLRPSQLLAILASSAEFINARGGLDVVRQVPVPVPVPVRVPNDVFFFNPFFAAPIGFGFGAGFTGFGGTTFGESSGGFSGSGSGF
jgi:hypothetical protein